MPIVISASRRERKTGVVPVFGLTRRISSGGIVNRRAGRSACNECRTRSSPDSRGTPSRNGEQAEADLVVNCAAEKECLVFEIQEGDEPRVAHKVSEERRRGRVGGDAGREDQATATAWADDRPGGLGEDGIGVESSVAGERIPVRLLRSR